MICRICEKYKTCDSPYCGDSSMIHCGNYEEAKPTNADRIRSMTDEELAKLLEGCVCPKSPCPDIDRDTPTDKMRCTKCWLEWLKQGASE